MEANSEQDQDLEVVKVTPENEESNLESTEEIKKEFKSVLQVSIFSKGVENQPVSMQTMFPWEYL